MFTKSTDDIRNELIDALIERLPNLDLTEGTPERDLFIEAPLAGQLMELWSKIIYTAKLFAPHVYKDDIEEADLINYMDNYGVSIGSSTYSAGTATFYANTQPNEDIIISDGSVISTSDYNPIQFIVQGSYTMYASIAESYYNAANERWEIICAVKAANPGSANYAGSNTVTTISGTIMGITGVTNTDPITGGGEAETVDDALVRVIEKFQGRGLSTTQGLQNYLRVYSSYVNVVGANDPAMLRDSGIGGAVDFYIIGDDYTNATDDVTITSTGLYTHTNVVYTSTGITLASQPVKELSSLIINNSVIPSSYFTLTKDTGLLKLSTRAYDAVTITSTGLANGVWFKANDTVEINYIYNALLATITTDLNSVSNHYQNRDYLVREMSQVIINTSIEVKEVSGQDWALVASAVETAISTFVNNVKTTGVLQIADVVGAVKVLSSVDNVNLDTIGFTIVGDGGTITSAGDIIFDKNEYPVSNDITVTRWTNA